MTTQERVKELGGEEGFWKSATEETLLDAIQELMSNGIDEDTAFDIIEPVFFAGQAEYGG